METAIPNGNAGDEALVDAGVGTNAIKYIWDEQDGWVQGGGVGASTFADLTGNPTDNSTLNSALNSRADKVISPTSGNLAALNAEGNLTDSGYKSSDFVTGTETIAFTNPIPFNKLKTRLEQKTVNENIVITPDTNSIVPGAETYAELIGDGVHNLTHKNIINIGALNYDKTLNMLNSVVYQRIGNRFYYQIVHQYVPDTVAPYVLYAQIDGGADANKIKIYYNELLSTSSIPALTDFTATGETTGARNPTALEYLSDQIILTFASNFNSAEAVSLAYVKGVNPIKDEDDNETAAFTQNVFNEQFVLDRTNQIFDFEADKISITDATQVVDVSGTKYVKKWIDLSGVGNDAVQSNNTRYPFILTDANSNKGVKHKKLPQVPRKII
ncbi:MAG: hypothetical protein HC905_09475 [Bacteroidales bacterium]|nr:hypothetical protein [Bacteroidales bacterium]